jgi:hypothetical protein
VQDRTLGDKIKIVLEIQAVMMGSDFDCDDEKWL